MLDSDSEVSPRLIILCRIAAWSKESKDLYGSLVGNDNLPISDFSRRIRSTVPQLTPVASLFFKKCSDSKYTIYMLLEMRRQLLSDAFVIVFIQICWFDTFVTSMKTIFLMLRFHFKLKISKIK